MLLDVRPFGIDSSVQLFLGMGPSHVRAFPPLGLDRIPGFLSCPCGLYSKTCNIRTIQGNVPSGKLIAECPFVETRCSRIYWRWVRGRVTSRWLYRLRNLSVNIAQKPFRAK